MPGTPPACSWVAASPSPRTRPAVVLPRALKMRARATAVLFPIRSCAVTGAPTVRVYTVSEAPYHGARSERPGLRAPGDRQE